MNYPVTIENIDEVSGFGHIKNMIEAIGKEDTCKVVNAFLGQESVIKPINFDNPHEAAKGFRYNSAFQNTYNKIKEVIGEKAADKLAACEWLQYGGSLEFSWPIRQFNRVLADWYQANNIRLPDEPASSGVFTLAKSGQRGYR